ncbi:hypothetical protein C0992_011321 [Termitomyces sp. T32_za158]|nr:hypothetical protein C0992_011321 [Termitomyces sp. T32_za158]
MNVGMNIDLLQQLSEQHAIAKRRPQEVEMWLDKTRLDHAAWAMTADGLAAWHYNQAQKRGGELAAAREKRLDA